MTATGVPEELAEVARELALLVTEASDGQISPADALAEPESLSDEEWAAVKYALLELGELLRDWSKPAKESSAA